MVYPPPSEELWAGTPERRRATAMHQRTTSGSLRSSPTWEGLHRWLREAIQKLLQAALEAEEAADPCGECDSAAAAGPRPGGAVPQPDPAPVRALDGAEMVILAVTSEGALAVLERAHTLMRPGVPLLVASKGLVASNGRVMTLSMAIRERWEARVVTIGGPSKAVELARRVPTEVIYASPDAQAVGQACEWMETSYYRVHQSADQQGLELCSALKNAYAIAVGLCDGLVAAGRAEALYNLKAALFSHAIEEMEILGRSVGIHARTFYGLGGVGDLFVTAVAGRNRRFGEMRGRGLPTAMVVERLKTTDELTEGYAAIRWCWQFAEEHAASERVPLLRALYRIVYEEADPARELWLLVSGGSTARA